MTHLRFALLALALPLSALAQTVTAPPTPVSITVNATNVVRTLDPRFYGINLTMWDNDLTTATTANFLTTAHFGSMRIPGGSLSDDYDWSTDLQISNSGTYKWPGSVGVFAKLIESQGSTAYVTVNYGSGTPEMAEALVAYFNGSVSNNLTIGKDAKNRDWQTVGYWAQIRAAAPLATDDGMNFLRISHPQPFAFVYFEVGNENYGSWEYDQHGVNNSGLLGLKNDPFTYANEFKNFAIAMKKADPTIKVGAMITASETDYPGAGHGVTNPVTGIARTGWTPIVLGTLKSINYTPDFLNYHYYAQNAGTENDNALLQRVPVFQQSATTIRGMLTDYIGKPVSDSIEIVMTELNSVSSNPGKQSANLVNGLFYADAYANLAQTEFNTAIWWDLHNGAETGNNNSSTLYGWRMFGAYDLISTTGFPGVPNFTPLPTFYGVKLLTHWARGGDQIVKTTSNYDWLSAYAATLANGKLALLVINKNPNLDVQAQIAVSGFGNGVSTATIYSYGKINDSVAADNPDLSVSTMSGVASNFTYTFPSYSMTVIQLDSTPTAPAISTQPVNTATSVGGSATFSVTAAGALPLSYQWYKDGVALGGQTGTSLTINNVQAADLGTYTVRITNSLGSLLSAGATLTFSTAHLGNVSMRANVAGGDSTPIVGIIVSGSAPTPILVRAVGPTLADYGVTSPLPDPLVELYDNAPTPNLITSNNDYAASLTAQMMQFGSFPLRAGSKDAALVQALSPGGYTAQLKSNAGVGVGLIEMYSMEGQGNSHLTNISARAPVGTGQNVLIVGFIVTGTGKMNVLIRAVGPKLSDYGVSGVLADPKLEIHDSTQATIMTNDNWETGNDVAAITAATSKAGAGFVLPAGGKDAATLLSLAPGGYTAVVSGVNNTTGIALVEVYEVP